MVTRMFSFHGSRYSLNTFDQRRLTRATRNGLPYEYPLLEHIYGLGLSGTAIDVGAHVGNHSLWFRLVCGFRVEAFEPIYAHQLRQNVRRNRAGYGISVHPFALGEASGAARQTGRINIEYGGGNILVRTLDSGKFRDVSLMKIDVEGLEPSVLRGAKRTLEREQPIIFAEQWDDDAQCAIADVLEPLGYTMTRLWTEPDLSTPMGEWHHD